MVSPLILAAAVSLANSQTNCPALALAGPRAVEGSAGYTVLGGKRIPPPDRHTPIPEGPLQAVSMKLTRSECFGSCPAYSVEIRGTGEVRFSGKSHVLVPGEHITRVDPAIAGCLFEAFRKADFWSLRPRYAADAFDLPTFKLTLSIGKESKTVVDYLGGAVGMPKAVADLENAVDSVAGTRRWISGDTGLIDWLAESGFEFHSKAAAAMAIAGLESASDETLVQLVERGASLEAQYDAPPVAPTETPPPSRSMGAELTDGAIRTGRADLFRRLVSRGWLRELGLPSANAVFASGAAGCRPELVDAAVEAGLDVNAATPAPPDANDVGHTVGGETALINLATSYDCAGKPARLATAKRLLDHGANPNIPNSDGETSIFKIENPDLLDLLLAHGADASARDKKGNSAVFSTWNDPVVLRLLQAGASPSGHYYDGYSLEAQAKARKMVSVQRWLADHRRLTPAP